MQNGNLPAYYYPTRVFFVDDNVNFLSNFSSQLHPNLAYELYNSPQEALRKLNSAPVHDLDSTNIISLDAEADYEPIASQTIKLDLQNIQQQLHNPQRFDEVSVVVVNYHMPTMDGLEFCHHLKDKPIRKIMLTSRASEQIAIDAFNEGLIDCFIRKQTPGLVKLVNDKIAQLRSRYFLDVSSTIIKLLQLDGSHLTTDPVFTQFFWQLCHQHNIVEFYLTEIPASFLLVDFDGKLSWLTVKRYEDISVYYALAEGAQAPAEALQSLRSADKLPYVWHVQDYYQLRGDDWQTHLYPATELVGKSTYYYAYITQLSGGNVHDFSNIISYREYLTQLEKQGYA